MTHERDPHRMGAFSWREAGLWSAAAVVIAGVYAGAGYWYLGRAPAAVKPAAAPEAIMVDLAPAPVAPPEPKQSKTVSDTDSEEVKAEPVPDPPQEKAEPVEPDLPDIEPLPPPEFEAEKPPPEPQPLDEKTAPPDAVADVPLPMARPTPPPATVAKTEPEKKHAPERRRPAPSRASERASIRAEAAPRAAARESSVGVASSAERAHWQARLLAQLERRQRYPPAARSRHEEGTASVRFRIDASGTVLSVSLARSSGSAALDAEVVAMVHRASPVPAPPAGVNRTIIVPIRFSLR